MSEFLLSLCVTIFALCWSARAGPLGEAERNRRSLADIIPQSKCYGVLGCFSTGGDFYDWRYRPLQKLPEPREEVKTRFLLFTRIRPQRGHFLVADANITIKGSMFNPSKQTKMIVHGFLDSGRTPWLTKMKNEFLKHGDYNVILVDWGQGSDLPYIQATANTRLVGAEIAYLIDTMRHTVSADPRKFHIIGHSLGAHVAGYAGERLKTLGRISGLDPAGPYFSGTKEAVHLDKSDAIFVDIMHTDGESVLNILINEGGFGYEEPTGHADFYPNGGKEQPDCDTNIIGEIVLEGLVAGAKKFVACDHNRAIDYFIDSINNECKYKSYPCGSYSNYQKGLCTSCRITGCNYMGFHAQPHKPGIPDVKYYLDTVGRGPGYCRYDLFIHMSLDVAGHTEKGKIFVDITGEMEKSTGMIQLHVDEDKKFEPGKSYFFHVPNLMSIGEPEQIRFKWESNPSWLKPWRWDIIHDARLNIKKFVVVDGESQRRAIFCNGQSVKDDTIAVFHPGHSCQ